MKKNYLVVFLWSPLSTKWRERCEDFEKKENKENKKCDFGGKQKQKCFYFVYLFGRQVTKKNIYKIFKFLKGHNI